MLTMTRRRMDTLNNFFKSILVVFSNEKDDLYRHFHAGYSSCVRESARRVDKRDVVLEQKFQDCELFSLALDTTLFGQEHVLSCVARLTFKDGMTQLPLFFGVCHGSTGDEIATYAFHWLKQNTSLFQSSDVSQPMVRAICLGSGME